MIRHDNYPDDIRSYDKDPRSPFYYDPCYGCDFDGDCDLEVGEDCYETKLEEMTDEDN